MIDNVWVLRKDEQISENSMLIFINKILNIMFILDKIFYLRKCEKKSICYMWFLIVLIYFLFPLFLIWHNVTTKGYDIVMPSLYKAVGLDIMADRIMTCICYDNGFKSSYHTYCIIEHSEALRDWQGNECPYCNPTKCLIAKCHERVNLQCISKLDIILKRKL